MISTLKYSGQTLGLITINMQDKMTRSNRFYFTVMYGSSISGSSEVVLDLWKEGTNPFIISS